MGVWQEIVDYTVPSNTTSVVLNDFGTITKDDFVKVVFTHVNPIASDSPVRILGNSSVDANYHRQFLGGVASTVVAGRSNIARAFNTVASATSLIVSYLKLSENDRLNTFNNYNETISSVVNNVFQYTTSSGATFTSGITSLTFQCETTNGLGTGSRIQIYKLAVEKVADITVSSNTTQVDISSLSIDKDSEYLLVGDVENNDNALRELYLYPNDLTTPSNYHSQMVAAEGSSASASRFNTSQLEFIRELGKTIFYTHIKLSNIGAFTFQNYALREYATTLPEIRNFFTSSTAENITSITKLNIVASASNAIKAGSRFTLYKLYE